MRANQIFFSSMEVQRRRENKKSIHKSINTNKVKYAIDETEAEEPSVTDNPVTNEPSYFSLFECGNFFLNKLDATCERACMATSKDNYHT